VTHPWPTGSFRLNWPLLANDLIVADWKIAGAAAADSPLLEETELEVLDPPPLQERDWHDTYALELASAPAIASDLSTAPGDGIELVLERAQLSAGERAVMRAWLYVPDLAAIAEDLAWRPQTVVILHRNALYKLRSIRENGACLRLQDPHPAGRLGHSPGPKLEAEHEPTPAESAATGLTTPAACDWA
jgi:hypothetical protein